jgi:hypothetical protein
VREFLERAHAWVDPCLGLSFVGRCSDSVAERCSSFGEGERRRLSFDCASVGLSCEAQNDGTIGCGVDDTYFSPPPLAVPAASAESVNSELFRAPSYR